MRRLLDQNPERERRRQIRILVVLERRFGRLFANEIARESRRLIEFYRQTGEVPPPSEEHRNRMMQIESDLAETATRAFGGRILDQGKALGLILETKFDFAAFFRRTALEWVSKEAIRKRITDISETTRAKIVSEVARGYAAGNGVDAIANEINKSVPRISKWRGALIGRTETHGAANNGAVAAASASGLKTDREWLSVNDSRTRTIGDGDQFDHAAMNRVRISEGEMFKVPKKSGGFELIEFPGGPSGSAGNVINCRCGTGFIVISSLLDELDAMPDIE